MGKSRLLIYLRMALGIALLLALVKMVDVAQIARVFASARMDLIVVALTGIVLNFFVMTYRWAAILWIQKPDISFGQLARFYFVSGFLTNFLPFSMSSDVLRIYCASKHTSDPKAAISSIVVDRIVGSAALAILTLIAVLVLEQSNVIQIGSLASFGVLVALLLSIVIPLALRASAVTGGVRRILRRFRGRLFRQVAEMYDNFLSYHNHRRVMTQVLLISFLSHLITIAVYYVVAESLAAKTWIGYFFLFIPLASFLAIVPVSVGGIGVIETAIVFLFSKVGMPAEMALSMALANRILLLIANLPGGVIYTVDGVSAHRLSLTKE